MVALVDSAALNFPACEPAKARTAVEREVVSPPPGLGPAPPPGLEYRAPAACRDSLRDAVRRLALENDRLKHGLCPDLARLRHENEALRAALLASFARYGQCAQAGLAPTEAAQPAPAPAPRRRRRGCRGGARKLLGKPACDVLSEVSTEEGPSEQLSLDSLRDEDSDLELLELQDDSCVVDLTAA